MPHIIKTPNGRYTFVGKVPTALVTDNQEVADTLALCGPGFARKAAKRLGARFTTSYETFEEAETALVSLV